MHILEKIGGTPVLKVSRIDTGVCELYLKLENKNPGGSIKDRVALFMVEEAEKKKLILPKGTIIEATAGNTGISLALVSLAKGYNCIFVIPDKMSVEKILHLKALGAKVIITRSDIGKGHPDYYHDLALKISQETPNSFFINQFENPANPKAHQLTTAPELWEQMGGKVDAVVCGVGSGGTLGGLTNFLKEQDYSTEIVLADPEGSIVADTFYGKKEIEVGSWIIEGIGEDYIPTYCSFDKVAAAYTIPDLESINACHLLAQKEGILAGSSSGTLLAAALKYCRAQTHPKRVVTFICDSGEKYLSKIYNPSWISKIKQNEMKI